MANEGNEANKTESKPESADIQVDPALAVNSLEQKNQKEQKNRWRLLAFLIASSVLVLGRSLIDGSIGKPTPFTFPDRIEFAQDQTKQLETKPPEDIVDPQEFFGQPKYLFGKKYSYLIDEITVDIALRYAVGTEGDLFWFLKGMANIEISENELRQKSVLKPPIGYYATFTHQNRAYLTACINPRGISTVTKEQFDDNASDRAMDRDVIIGWLLGQKDLRDRRCLWTLMSTPITSDNNLNTINQKLENVWVLWYEWWKFRFPQP